MLCLWTEFVIKKAHDEKQCLIKGEELKSNKVIFVEN